MKELDKVLAELASKLGVAVETLWNALLRQALISGITDVIQYSLVAAGWWFTIKICRNLQKKIASGEDLADVEAPYVIVLLVMGLVLTVLSIAMFFSIDHTLAAFFNPEYWALKQIWKR